MIAPSPVASPLLEFSAPVYMEFTDKTNRRALVDHFCNVLSHLIVFKEDTGNPFRQLVLPLSHASSPVMNAIFALSSAHLEYRGIENEEKSLTFHNRALQGLAQLIDQNDEGKREEVLGAIMLLVYYEVVGFLNNVNGRLLTTLKLVQRGNSNIVKGHLKGAMTIMKSGPQVTTPTTLFLERVSRDGSYIIPHLTWPGIPILRRDCGSLLRYAPKYNDTTTSHPISLPQLTRAKRARLAPQLCGYLTRSLHRSMADHSSVVSSLVI
jgi:hypothetical protein